MLTSQNFQWCFQRVFLWTFSTVFFINSAFADERNAEKQLLDKLFTNYDKRVRPLRFSNESVTVKLQYWLVNINDLNERLQQLETVGWIQMEWMDEYLTWNPEEYANLKYVVVQLDDIWHPDIVIRNRYWTSVDKVYGDILDYSSFKTMIYSEGHVSFTTSGRIITSCPVDLTYFPFDLQTCYVHLDSWTYSIPQVRLDNLSSVINRELYHENGQWDLLDTLVKKYEEPSDGENYTEIKFYMQLRRKPGYYGTTLVIPCAMMSAMVVVVFILPPDADEKISLSATMLLSYSVFQLLIVNIMPQTSDYTPIMTIYLLTVMLIAALSLFSTVIVLRMYHNSTTPPDWLYHLTFHYLARIFCMWTISKVRRRPTRDEPTSPATSTTTVPPSQPPDVTRGHDHDSFSLAASSNTVDNVSTTSDKCICTHIDDVVIEEANHFEWRVHQAMISIRSLTRCINKRMESRALEQRNEEIWHDIAHVFDRVFFIFYLTLTFIACAVLLGIYPQTGPNAKEPIDVYKKELLGLEASRV